MASKLMTLISFLNRNRIHFRLDQQSDDAVMVSFSLVGMRIEVEVFDDRLEFSTFEGDESVETSEDKLYLLIKERGEIPHRW
jgi:hypothetical protein